jgi:hypothetical protein
VGGAAWEEWVWASNGLMFVDCCSYSHFMYAIGVGMMGGRGGFGMQGHFNPAFIQGGQQGGQFGGSSSDRKRFRADDN